MPSSDAHFPGMPRVGMAKNPTDRLWSELKGGYSCLNNPFCSSRSAPHWPNMFLNLFLNLYVSFETTASGPRANFLRSTWMHKKSFWTLILAILAFCVAVQIPADKTAY